ncbi:GNAT family N-acetyltransferase [Actinomadura sp. KC216]|uniref:GNAT family N-acetyltransferase n=1 Tax=Actinomadura sp. KC216 TaxID=2530370 RepID=UPI001046E5F4|nr:GNAT family N-acetyltransferase [Actinomadura sp. KC216]TDB78613.1 GNAT family N-acetyltransferase [Actinomadura sp. KC216]
MTWTTRQERPGDRAAVRAVVEAAFPTAAEADLVDALREDAAWVPELSMVAEAPGGAVAGYALATRCRVGEGPAEVSAALALAPVAVLPRWQRHGAGGAAVRAVLAAAAGRAAAGRGERLVVVLGHPEYYPRFGFARASSLGVGVAFEVPDEALMALVLDGPGPVPSGTVAYPAPFGV